MPRFRRIRDYDPKSYYTLIIDILTLVPINGVYYLFCYVSGTIDAMNFRFHKATRMKSVIRLYRVYLYTLKMKSQAGKNELLVDSLAHFVLVALLVHAFGSVWYLLSCFECDRLNWTIYLDYHIFDASSILDWFVICFTNIGIALQHCYRGN